MGWEWGQNVWGCGVDGVRGACVGMGWECGF